MPLSPLPVLFVPGQCLGSTSGTLGEKMAVTTWASHTSQKKKKKVV